MTGGATTRWSKISEDGFGEPLNVSVRGMAEFKDQLYVGLMNFWNLQVDPSEKYSENGVNKNQNWRSLTLRSIYSKGCELWRTKKSEKRNGKIEWQPVVSDRLEKCEKIHCSRGFGDENNWGISILIEFKDSLYAGTFNPYTGCEIFRSKDGVEWSPVVGNNTPYIEEDNNQKPGLYNLSGFGNPHNWAAWTAVEFKGYLYVGTMNFVDGCELYRTNDGVKWECLVGNFSKKIDSGFGRLIGKNVYVWTMKEFNEELFLGTCSLSKAYPLSFLVEHILFTEEQLFNLKKPNFLSRGCEVWKSRDGKKWDKIIGGLGILTAKPAGFGDRDNWGARVMEVFKGKSGEEYLYVGTAVNVFAADKGGQVWRRDKKGNWSKGPVFDMVDFRDPYLKYIWCMKSLDSENKLFVGLGTAHILGKRAGQIWSTEHGDRGSWVKENVADFKNNWDSRPRSMTVFNDELFAGTLNFCVGCGVLRRKKDGKKEKGGKE